MDFIPQMEPWFGNEEKIAISNYMDEGGWLTEFKHTQEFEKRIASYTGAKHCIVVNNGTISLTLMSIAVGIKYGDEVIVPNYTMIATPNSVQMIGAVPVFVDVEPETLCLDFDKMKSAVTSKTKAIIFVNANGRNPKNGIEKYIDFCNENNILLLEDAAQSLGSFYPNGKHQGTMSLAGSFSFSAPKIISTGQGGAIVTNNDEINFKLRRLKDFGRSGGGNDVHDSIGFNFKFTEMQAVIGNEQMKKLEWRVVRKKQIYQLYKTLLKDVNQIKFFDQDLTNTTPWFIDVLAEKREGLQAYLKGKSIGTRIMYPPINKQVAYQVNGEHNISNLVGTHGLWLPSAAQLTDENISYICKEIAEFYHV
jgi:perosamine synthetase